MIERITFFSSPSDSVPPLLLWSAQREVFFHPQCCHCPSLSLSLLMLIWSRHTERNVCMCVCVCVFTYSCCSATSSAFFAPSIFVLYQSCFFFLLLNICHPIHPSFLFPFLSPSLYKPTKKAIPLVAMGSGCHAAARFSRGPRVCVRVYCSATESGCHVDGGQEGERCGVRMWGFRTGRCHLVRPRHLTHIPTGIHRHTHTHTHTHPRGRKAIDHVM